jgi:hypothetical protein
VLACVVVLAQTVPVGTVAPATATSAFVNQQEEVTL